MHDRCKTLPVCLSFISTAITPARTERFSVADHFVEDVSAKAKIKISHLGVGFRLRFIEDGGKIEEPVGPTALFSHKLFTESIDSEIIETLGEESHVASTLWDVFTLMEKQPTGRSGVLNVNNHLKNIFYVLDRHGVLCTVLVSWYHPGWFVGAVELTRVRENRNHWGIENQIFSHVATPIHLYKQCASLG